jgi:hypothetical protein
MKLVSLIKMYLNEAYNKIHVGKHLSDMFSIQNGILLGRFRQARLTEIKWDTSAGLHWSCDNINTIKKNTEALIDASKGVGLEVNIKKTKYMLMSCHQSARKKS